MPEVTVNDFVKADSLGDKVFDIRLRANDRAKPNIKVIGFTTAGKPGFENNRYNSQNPSRLIKSLRRWLNAANILSPTKLTGRDLN